MVIDKTPYWFTVEGIGKIEEKYGAIYMGHWCTKHSAGWWNEHPVDVFYQPNPDFDKGHSHYFGMFVNDGNVYITNAESVFSTPITGLLTESGEVIVSRFRHDCVTRDDSMIDGGRNYLRYSGGIKLVKVSVTGDAFEYTDIDKNSES